MATELAKAYVQIIPSAEGIKQQLSNLLGKEVGGAGAEAGKSLGSSLVSSLKSVVMAAGLGTVIKEAFSEGADLQQSIGGVETLFKDSADKVLEAANNAYKTAGMSANEYMETVTGFSASLLQGLGGDTEKAADVADMALTDMSDNANKMGTSMELIQNAYQGFAKQNYTMLDNLKLGYGGTKTEMERLLADAQAFSGVKYDINNLSDVYEAIHVIQENMDITGTTAKEAASTFSGSMASMTAAAKNLLGKLTLGEDLQPALSALSDTVFTFVGGNLMPMLGNLFTALPTVITEATSMMIRGLNLAGSHAGEFVNSGIELIKNLVVGMVSQIPYLLESVGKLAYEFGRALVETDWQSVISDMLMQLKSNMDIAAGEILGSDSSLLEAVCQGIQETLPVMLEKGKEIITNLVNGIWESIPALVTMAGELISQFASHYLEKLPIVWQSGVDLLLELVNGILDNLPMIVESVLQIISQFVETILKSLPDILQSGIEIIGELAAGIIQAIPDIIGLIPQIFEDIKEAFGDKDWLSIGGDIISGIVKGIMNGISSIIEAAEEVAGKAVDTIKEVLGIHSPSRVFENEVGKMIDLGLAAGIENNTGVVSKAMKNLSASASQMLDSQVLLRGSVAINAYETGGKNISAADAMLELARVLSENPTRVTVNLEGDAKRLFRVMQSEAKNNLALTGRKA